MTIKGKIRNSIENGYNIMSRYEAEAKHICNVFGDCRDDVIAEKLKEAPFAEISTCFRTVRALQALSSDLKTPQWLTVL